MDDVEFILETIDRAASDHIVSAYECDICGMHYYCSPCGGQHGMVDPEHQSEKIKEAVRAAMIERGLISV